ncbi:MAG: hypothetical protein ACE5FN_12655 [Leptospirillia bacterium]
MPTLVELPREALERMVFQQGQRPYEPSGGMRPLFALNGEGTPFTVFWPERVQREREYDCAIAGVAELAAEGVI